MVEVLFWEKPGCAGNARQKARLRASGHALVVRDLLREPWTAERLRGFFGDLPVAEWFNRAAPAVKSGTIVPEAATAETALAAMLATPLLIRRPLMEIDGTRVVGFDEVWLAARIGLAPTEAPVGEACPRTAAAETTACPAPPVTA